MKKYLVLLLFSVLFIPTIVSAHTGLEASNPKEGEVVKKDLKDIQLIFESNIENLSTMKLIQNQKEIPFAQLKVEGKQLTGSLSSPLENGTYRIQWKIVGHDGHPITGNVSFTVDQPKIKEEVKAAPVQPKESVKAEPSKNQTKKEETKKKNPSFNPAFVMIGLGIILILGALFLFKKKK